jgi:hypothetical protein
MHIHGCSDLVKARSMLLSGALRSEAEMFVLIDSDIVPTTEQLELLTESPQVGPDKAVTGAYYSQARRLSFHVKDRTREFSLHGSPRFVECWGAGLGFSVVHRESVERLAERLPKLADGGTSWWPFCLPQIVADAEMTGGKTEYLSEDNAFWWRLRKDAETTLWLDTHIAVGHLATAPLIPEEGLIVDPT